MSAAPHVDLLELCRWVAEESLLFADEASPFRAAVTDGDRRLVVVAGENASGKSVFFRVLSVKAHQAGVTPVTLSIRERAGAGSGEMSGLRRVMVFGGEAEQSTGATSVQVIAKAFDANLDRPEGSMLGLDEPELGLSEGYTRALGAYIGSRAAAIPEVCSGVVVVTHSRALVAAALDAFGAQPTSVRCGPGPATLDEWLGEVEERSVDELLARCPRWAWNVGGPPRSSSGPEAAAAGLSRSSGRAPTPARCVRRSPRRAPRAVRVGWRRARGSGAAPPRWAPGCR